MAVPSSDPQTYLGLRIPPRDSVECREVTLTCRWPRACQDEGLPGTVHSTYCMFKYIYIYAYKDIHIYIYADTDMCADR